ncbi:MAG TPA: hypothetical protein VEI03_20775 [Stellaceae bacterium]|nr:hypothetical protein [Stellaceae bacterium]
MPAVRQIETPVIGKAAVRAFSARDAAVVAFLPLQFLISWCVPERLWPACARLLHPLTAFLYVKGGDGTRELIATVLEQRITPRTSRQIVQELAADEFISILQILRDYRPGRWRPKIEITGTEHLRTAIDGGKGVILWVSYTHGAKLVGKMAIRQAGYPVSHLSRPRHGLSPTKFGIRFLNRIQTTIENRYLTERIVIHDGEFHKAMRSLIARLRANGIISITVHRDAARPTSLPFLQGRIVLADGACRLSHKTGAALLPVTAYRRGREGLKVEIDAPINSRQPESEDDAVSRAHRDYIARLERFVLAHPGQWRGWYQLS